MDKTTKTVIKDIRNVEVVDKSTGEVIETTIATVDTEDNNFEKFFLSAALGLLDELTNKRMKIFFHLVKTRNKQDNSVHLSYTSIMKELKIGSRATISKTFKILKKNKIIIKHDGIWYINPSIIFKGNNKKRQAIMFKLQTPTK